MFAKRKQIRQLSKYLSPDLVKAVAKGALPLASPKIQSGRIEFVFVLVRADSPQQLEAHIGLVEDAGHKHDAVVHSVVGPMVVMAFGTLKSAQHSATSRTKLVSYMQEQFGSQVRIVHGAADGHFGNFGGDRSIHYTFTFPSFGAALAALGRLEFEQTEELPELRPGSDRK
jgi:hypothetical protein